MVAEVAAAVLILTIFISFLVLFIRVKYAAVLSAIGGTCRIQALLAITSAELFIEYNEINKSINI